MDAMACFFLFFVFWNKRQAFCEVRCVLLARFARVTCIRELSKSLQGLLYYLYVMFAFMRGQQEIFFQFGFV